jgi:hypothetical protein
VRESERARERESERARERESERARERESERAREQESKRAREREIDRERERISGTTVDKGLLWGFSFTSLLPPNQTPIFAACSMPLASSFEESVFIVI